MNYIEGVAHMKELASKLQPKEKESFSLGPLTINYPGYKREGDYQLTINGLAPKHTDIVNVIYATTNTHNLEGIIAFLDDVYTNGLKAKSTVFPEAFIQKIYWITLQEEINYPQPRFQGRKLTFQRFYEGALAKVSTTIDINFVKERTNNHGSSVPKLFEIKNYTIPSFYNLLNR